MSFQSAVARIEAFAKTCPTTVAMRQKRFGIWQEHNWAEVNVIIRDIAAALVHFGIQPDDKVGILSENRREWILAELGIFAARASTVGMYATSPAIEIEHFVIASDTRLLFIEDQEQYDKIAEIKDKLPKLEKLVVFDPEGLGHESLFDLQSFDDFLAQGARPVQQNEVARRIDAIEADDTCLLVFTSGSTGKPKAAEITHGNLHHQMTLVKWLFGEKTVGSNVLSYLPLNHVAEQAITLCSALSGPRVMNFGESLRTITLDLRDVAPELFFGVPRIWEKMQALIQVQAQTAGPLRRAIIARGLASAKSRHDVPRQHWGFSQKLANAFWDALVYRHMRSYLGLGRCKYAISAAAPVSEDVLKFFRGIGINVREVWGMTETSGAACAQDDWGDCMGRVGRFPPEVEWKIAPDGELLVKGNIIFKGYYRNRQATEETIVGGWLHTGDVASAEEDGTISIIDRKKDIMINAAGKNLSPSLIENAMKTSPFIKECIVIADQRPYVSGLVQIDFETVRLWAETENIVYTTFRSLAENAQVKALIDAEVAKFNAGLAPVEQIKKVHLLVKELDHDDGEVTATMKVRRSKIAEAYAPEINALYA